jgi:hypothetical protein
MLFHGPNAKEAKVEDRGSKERIGASFNRALEIFQRTRTAASY